MMFRTHMFFAIFIYFSAIKLFHLDFSFIPFISIIFGSALPDIDHPKSFVNKYYLIGIGKIVSIFSQHRGFWHSIFGLAAISLIFYILISLIPSNSIINLSIILFLTCGYFLHLIADSFTPSGIKWLWKFSKFKTKGFIRTNSLFENILFLALILGSVYTILGAGRIKNIFDFINKIK